VGSLDRFLNPYYWIVFLRRTLYGKGIFKRCSPEWFTVSVGNLSVGGTGKTPVVSHLAKHFLKEGKKIAILLRGYKRKNKGPLLVSDGKDIFLSVERAGDEAFLYANLLKVPVVVAERRCEGLKLLKDFNIDVLLLDDAFQHLAIERHYDIVLLTPKDLRERLLPFGRLREPLEVLEESGNYCLFTKTYKPVRELEKLCSEYGKKYGYLTLKGYKLFNRLLEEIPLNTLTGKELIAVSAVGDNKGFEIQIRELSKRYNVRVKAFYQFRDHYDYKDFVPPKGVPIITTFKDFFKLKHRGVENEMFILDREFELPANLLRDLKIPAEGGRKS
jgi:tetraacyldisaccharide 4'-kinase